MDFNAEEKAQAFEQIVQRYYKTNFGTMSKTDFETLLFHNYMEHLLSHGEAYDDYTVSNALGITQSKVRNLKLRRALQYPGSADDWKAQVLGALKNAKYDRKSGQVQMLIPENTVMVELRHFLESNGGFDTYTLNPKLFSCRVDHLVLLFEALSEQNVELDDEQKKQLRQLKLADGDMSALEKICSGAYKDGLKDLVLTGSKQALTEVLKLIPFGGLAADAVGEIIKLIEKS